MVDDFVKSPVERRRVRGEALQDGSGVLAQTRKCGEAGAARVAGVHVAEVGHLGIDQLRLLTSAEMDSATPRAVLLVGQPTLARQLRMAIFAAYVARPIMLHPT